MHHTLLNNKPDIEAWLQDHGIKGYKINPDMSVDVNRDVDISERNLRRIGVQFNHVEGSFDCDDNRLVSLLGAPRSIVDGGFYCSHNKLTSLEFCPPSVELSFFCSYNQLRSLEYGPHDVGRVFDCKNNEIESLLFFPKHVGIHVECDYNPLLGRAQYISDFNQLKEIHLTTFIQYEQAALKNSLSNAHTQVLLKTHKI